MQSINIEPNLQKTLQEILLQYPQVMPIIRSIAAHGGRALLVGGAVRDLFMQVPVKDLDIEVYGLSVQKLEALLRTMGSVSLVGKVFGVLRLHGLDVDWSLPRSDSSGRKPTVMVDPAMSFTQSFGRRDLTINAMGIDLMSYELIDPYNGLDDLANKLLRAPQEQFFAEDPLRFYRVMQFISRFEMTPDAALNALCATMSVADVSRERIEQEIEKMFLKSRSPSRGLRWIRQIGRLAELFPELAATVGVAQEYAYHPEGDVFEHSMQALDAAARLSYDTSEQKMIVMTAALCHDFGKPSTTTVVSGRIISHGHDAKGVEICVPFLKRITRKKEILDAVPKLVRYHMQPVQFVLNGAGPSAYKRLARALAPQVTITMLAQLAIADMRGRNGIASEPLDSDNEQIALFLHTAQSIAVHHKPEEPVLQGRDISHLVSAGPAMGELLKKAYEIQLEEGIRDKQVLVARLFKK